MIASLITSNKLDHEVLLAALSDLEEALRSIDPLMYEALREHLTADHLSADHLSASCKTPFPPSAHEHLHKFLFDIHITKGTLIDSVNGREFKIENGIPNLILLEDELE